MEGVCCIRSGGVKRAAGTFFCDDEYDSVVGGNVPYWHGKGERVVFFPISFLIILGGRSLVCSFATGLQKGREWWASVAGRGHGCRNG